MTQAESAQITYPWLMYIDIVPNRGSPPAILLRESVREGKRVRKRTVANLSGLTIEQAEAMRHVLRGTPLAPIDAAFEVTRSQAPPGTWATSRPSAPPCAGWDWIGCSTKRRAASAISWSP